jgi:hypothetical protein
MAVLGGQVYTQLGIDDKQFTAGLRNADSAVSNFSNGIKTAVSSIAALASVRIGMGWARQLIQTGDEIQKFKVQMNAALQDTEKASQRMGEAIHFAMTTPFQSADAIKAMRDLSLLNFSDTEKGMRGIGNLAMTFGRNMEDVSQALYSMNTMVMRQFGIEVDRMGSQWQAKFRGQVYYPVKNDIASLRELIINQIGNIDLAGGIEAGAKTIGGQWAQFGDRIAEVKKGIMETNDVSGYLTNTLQNVVQEFYRWNHSAEGMVVMKSLAQDLRGTIDTVAAGARAFGQVLVFAAKNAETLKNVMIAMGAMKVFNILVAGYRSINAEMLRAQAAASGTTASAEAQSMAMSAAAVSTSTAATAMSQLQAQAGTATATVATVAASLDSVGLAMARFNATQGVSPFRVMTGDIASARASIASYAQSFLRVDEQLQVTMAETISYIGVLNQLSIAETELQALNMKRNSMMGVYGRDTEIASTEQAIAAKQREIAAINERSLVLKQAALDEQNAIAKKLGYTTATKANTAAQRDNVQAILAGEGALVRHVVGTRSLTAEIITNTRAMAANAAARTSSAAASFFPPTMLAGFRLISEWFAGLGGLVGSAAGAVAGFGKTVGAAMASFAPMIGMMAVFTEATAAIGAVSESWHNYSVAVKGARVNPLASVPEQVNAVENEIRKLQERTMEYQEIQSNIGLTMLHPFKAMVAYVDKFYGYSEAAAETLENQLSTLRTEEKLLESIEATENAIALRELSTNENRNVAEAALKRIAALEKERLKTAGVMDEEERKAFEKETKVGFSKADLKAAEAEFHKYVTAIQWNTREALESAERAAIESGTSVTEAHEAVYAEAAEQMEAALKKIEKAAGPTAAAMLRVQLPKSSDGIGHLDEIITHMKDIDVWGEKIQRSVDLAKYFEVPRDAFVPQLKEYLKTLKPLSEEWKKIKNAIDDATEAENDYQDALAGKTEDILSRLKDAFDNQAISPTQYLDAIKKNMPVVISDIERDMGDLFKGSNLNAAQKQAIILGEVEKRLAAVGLSAAKYRGQIIDFGLAAGTSADWFQKLGSDASVAYSQFGKWDATLKEVKTDLEYKPTDGFYKNTLFGKGGIEALIKDIERMAETPERILAGASMQGAIETGIIKPMEVGLEKTGLALKHTIEDAGAEAKALEKGVAADSGENASTQLAKTTTATEKMGRVLTDATGAALKDFYEMGNEASRIGAILKTSLTGIINPAELVTAFDPMVTKMQEAGEMLAAASKNALSPWSETFGPLLDGAISKLRDMPSPELPKVDSVGVSIIPVVTSLQTMLAQENLSVQSLIQANNALEGRMKSLEAALAKADFRTIKQEIDMDIDITTTETVAEVETQLQQNFGSI